MKNLKSTIIAFILAILFPACSQEAPTIPVKAEENIDQKKRKKPPTAMFFYESTYPETIGNETFSASPGMICDTNTHPIEVSVKWNLPKIETDKSFIYVTSQNGEKKLWLSGGKYGEAITGKWIFPGSRLTLYKEVDGSPISELVIESITCK